MQQIRNQRQHPQYPQYKGINLRPGVPIVDGNKVVWISKTGEIQCTPYAPHVHEMISIDEYSRQFGGYPGVVSARKPKGTQKKKKAASKALGFTDYLIIVAATLAAFILAAQ